MNRTGIFATVLIACFLPANPSGAQTALVVGAVRDQHGAAIERATVTALDRSGARLASAATDAAGTFAIAVSGAERVRVACRYCLSRAIAVTPGQPALVIVRRFDALAGDAPTPADLANLPYAGVESAVALRPFSLLRQTTSVLPGSQLSDRGLAPAGALLVDAGVPDYDFVLATTPYDTVPQTYEQTATVAPPAQAFTYGDRAASGVVTLDPFYDQNAETVLTGGDQTLRLQVGTDLARAIAATYSNDWESRQRADADVQFPLSTAQTLAFSGGTSQGRQYGNPQSWLDANFSFARGAFDDVEPNAELNATLVTDRGTYAAGAGDVTLTDVWSDAALTAGVRTRGPISTFAEVSDRLSTGIYDAQAYDAPRIAGTLTQSRVDAGVDAVTPDLDVVAGVGWFGVGFTGGSYGVSVPASGHLATPSLDVRAFPNSRWSLDVNASDSFTLPTLWEQYAPYGGSGGLVYDRNALYAATLSYTDQARLRIEIEDATQSVSGFTNGVVTSSGLAVSWQIAPVLALRAWAMHVGDTTAPSNASPYAPYGQPAGVNAFWLTYDNAGALRVDAIYRRDLLDGHPFEHVDGDVSGPLGRGLRWYAGVEDRQHATFLDIGLRFSTNP